MTERTEMKCIRCQGFSSSRVCWSCSQRLDAVTHARVEQLEGLLTHLRQWDMLDACADGDYWKREIDAVLNAAPQVAPSACQSDAGSVQAGSAGPAVAAPTCQGVHEAVQKGQMLIEPAQVFVYKCDDDCRSPRCPAALERIAAGWRNGRDKE